MFNPKKRSALPPIDPRRRYPTNIAAEYLGICVSTLYADIKGRRIKTIKDRKRRFVPGSEIIRRSSVSP